MSKFALLFIMVFMAGVVATFFYSGASAFFLYQLVYFLNPDNRWWSAEIPGLSYSFIAAVLMLVALGIRYRRYTDISPWKEQPIFKWAIAILILYYLVGLIALLPDAHYRFAFNYLKLIVIMMVAYKLVNTQKLLDMALWAYVIGATYIGYLATITGRARGGRVEGIGMVDSPDANDTAAALVPAGAILLYFFWMGSRKVKLVCVFCGAFIANGLVLINSRGSFLGVISSAGLYLLYMAFSKYRKKGQRAVAIFTLILGVSGGLYVADDTFWERMATLQNLEDQQVSGSSRVNYWIAALEMSVEHPLGLGVHGFNMLAELYIPEEFLSGTVFKSVHSMWMQGLTEVGWLGLGFFVAMLFSLWRLSRRAKKWLLTQDDNVGYFKLLALECALLGYLVTGTFINRFRAEVLYWVVLLLAIAINVYFLQQVRQTKAAKGRYLRQQPIPIKEQQA